MEKAPLDIFAFWWNKIRWYFSRPSIPIKKLANFPYFAEIAIPMDVWKWLLDPNNLEILKWKPLKLFALN